MHLVFVNCNIFTCCKFSPFSVPFLFCSVRDDIDLALGEIAPINTKATQKEKTDDE